VVDALEIAKAILKEINERLGFLNNVGLDYLNLDRTSGTLSGGEASASASPARSAPA
jgi:excinuclease UvrABC ATPase subunit